VHDVALVEDHVNTAALPAATAAAFAVNATVGTGGATTSTMTVAGLLAPPGPVQVNE
jgi:hypothetical protein